MVVLGALRQAVMYALVWIHKIDLMVYFPERGKFWWYAAEQVSIRFFPLIPQSRDLVGRNFGWLTARRRDVPHHII
jgi:hypothetical protein